MLWGTMLGLTVLVAVIAFYPLLRNRTLNGSVQQQDLNKAFYFDSLQEVQRAGEQGLLDDARQIEQELQQRLLNDIPEQQSAVQPQVLKTGKIWFVSATLVLGAIALASYFQVGSWHAEKMLAQAHDQLPHFYQRLENEKTQPLSMDELQQFTIALRAELQRNPQDDKAWWLLGQIGMNAGNGQLALDSYKRAWDLQPNNHEYQLSYARVLMFSEDENDKSRGEALLRAVIKQDHSNVQALSLLAFRAFEKEDYQTALVSWQMMLKLLPPDDERVPLIQRSISHAIQTLQQK